MRRPFGKLMNMLNDYDMTGLTLEDLAQQTGETTERIMDALDANKERKGQPSYITIDEIQNLSDEAEHGYEITQLTHPFNSPTGTTTCITCQQHLLHPNHKQTEN